MSVPVLDTPQVAVLRLDAGRVYAQLGLALTPAGLLAIGGLVAAILWSVPPIVDAAGRIARAARAA